MSNALRYTLVVLAGLLILLLGYVAFLIARDQFGSSATAQPPDTVPATTVAEQPTAVPTETSLAQVPAEPGIEVLPTLTPLPTSTASPTPEATATPLPTDTPEPTLTPTPVPVVIVPTNPPPPPTAPPAPTSPPPPPPDTRGLTATAFNIQDRSSFTVNGQIWFDFVVVNNTGGEVPYNSLGVMPRKDGVDRLDWYQHSYGGPNSTMKPEGRVHEDNIRIPESGNMTLRLVICFDGYDNCLSGGGTWHSLSPEVPVTIN